MTPERAFELLTIEALMAGCHFPAAADLFDPPAWHAEALCRHRPDLDFFPARGKSTTEAKALCAACPVADECGSFALASGEKYGIWGGMSERGRRGVRSARRTAA